MNRECPPKGGARNGAAGTLWYLRLRRPVQTAVVLLFLALPQLSVSGRTKINGSLFAFDMCGLPLADPLSALQVLIVGNSFAPRLCLGAGLVLLFAFSAGRFFCGWLCPYGLFSEQVHALRRKLRPCAAAAQAEVKSPPLRRRKMPNAFYGRAAVCALGIAAGLHLGLPALQRLSLPGELSLAPLRAVEGWDMLLGALLFPAAVLLAEGVSGERLWCRFICPQSVCLGLAARCNPRVLGVYWTAARCNCRAGDRPCSAACSLRLEPRRKNGPSRIECVQCGDCLRACAQRGGALRAGFGPDKE